MSTPGTIAIQAPAALAGDVTEMVPGQTREGVSGDVTAIATCGAAVTEVAVGRGT